MVYRDNANIGKLGMIKQLADKRFLKFLVVGASGTAIDFILFYLCYQVSDWGIILSNTISYGTGITSSFFINRAWTFADGQKRSHKRLVLALALGYLGLVLNTAMVWAFSLVMHVFIGKTIAVFVIVIYNYLTNKHIVFLAK